MEDESTLPHALLIIGILCIIIFSICIAWLIVLCERLRRKRKFRPGVRNRSAQGVKRSGGHEPNISRHFLRPPPHQTNLVIANKAFLSKSTPEICTDDLLDPILDLGHSRRRASLSFNASCEPPMFPFEEISVHDQIAAILGTFPDLKFKCDTTEEDEGPETGVDDETVPLEPSPLSSHPSLLPPRIQLLWGEMLRAEDPEVGVPPLNVSEPEWDNPPGERSRMLETTI